MKRINGCGLAAVILMSLSSFSPAQWLTQNIPLKAGWNAIQLRVQPAAADCDTVLSGHPVECVWRWNIRYTTVQFDLDPAQVISENTDWVTWLPTSHPQSYLRNLFSFQAGQRYLFKVASNTAPFTLAVKGTPGLPVITWYPAALNLAGLPVAAANPPTFADFFRHTPDIGVMRLTDGGEVFAITTNGAGREIMDPDRERIESGVAYWIRAKNETDYTGPVKVVLDYGTRLDFDVGVSERTLTVRNITTNASFSVAVAAQNSEAAPDGETPVAGAVPLSYFVTQPESNLVDWVNFPSTLSKIIAPGEDWAIRLTVRRAELAAPGRYQSLLRITEAGGLLDVYVPVSAEQP